MPTTDCTLNLPPVAASASEARNFVGTSLLLHSPESPDVAVLLASELVTNAVLHGAGEISVRVSSTPRAVRVAVADHGADLPAPTRARTGAASGRGLDLVEMLSSAWGVVSYPGDGKAVWFELPVAVPATS